MGWRSQRELEASLGHDNNISLYLHKHIPLQDCMKADSPLQRRGKSQEVKVAK